MSRLCYLCCFVLICQNLIAQPCINVTPTNPYFQDFESGNGGWFSGGNNSDWAYGTPSKPLINSAFSGTKCWITGGLNGVSYNYGEAAWIQSPCFDISSLAYPELRLKLFWDTERLYDGTALQYSLDDGISWFILGDINSIPHCRGTNWYNTNTSFSGNFHSWSGNTKPDFNACLGGNGSGSWLTVRHVLEEVTGASSIRFRFMFTAGITCNTYDGFAIDDFRIVETAPDPVYFDDVVCISHDTKQFFLTGNCPGLTLWDFGDPSSGNNNFSAVPEPVHQFSGPGRYTVTVRTATTTGFSKTLTREVVVLDADTTISWPGRCDEIPNASISVVPSGATSPYTYSWNTTPPQTGPTLTNLGPGNYVVKINATDACEMTIPFQLTLFPKMAGSVTTGKADCYNDNGSITSTITGGATPYTYAWSDGSSAPAATNLAPGLYDLEVIDAVGCRFSLNDIRVTLDSTALKVNLGPDMSFCTGETILVEAGSFDHYLWQDGSTGSSITVSQPGTYFVEVRQDNGCVAKDTIAFPFDCSDLYFPTAFTPNLDNLNDGFGGLGTQTPYVKNYQLQVYNRTGQVVFATANLFNKWDGMFKGLPVSQGNYVWQASYVLNGRKRARKGSVLLIR